MTVLVSFPNTFPGHPLVQNRRINGERKRRYSLTYNW